MPKYLDHHKVPAGITPEAIKQMTADIKAGKVGPGGVKALNSFIGKNEAWCFVEAPNAQAVHKLHEDGYKLKLGPGDVVEVTSFV